MRRQPAQRPDARRRSMVSPVSVPSGVNWWSLSSPPADVRRVGEPDVRTRSRDTPADTPDPSRTTRARRPRQTARSSARGRSGSRGRSARRQAGVFTPVLALRQSRDRLLPFGLVGEARRRRLQKRSVELDELEARLRRSRVGDRRSAASPFRPDRPARSGPSESPRGWPTQSSKKSGSVVPGTTVTLPSSG